MSVAKAYADLKSVSEILADAAEVSLKLTIDENAAKIILLGAASEFEVTLCEAVRRFVRRASNGNEHIECLIERKGISRQYHTWFDWEKNNANKFYSLFGEIFLEKMKEVVKNDAEFSEAVTGFLEIGLARNTLVHNNFSGFYLEKTAAEFFILYEKASKFVARIDAIFLDLAPEKMVEEVAQ